MSKKKSNEEIFKVGSTYARHALKRKLINEHLVKYECSCCENPGEWMGKPLALQLDHINGIFNDNRLENLQFLCANCHSQTDSYAGKNSSGMRSPGKDKMKSDYRYQKRRANSERWKFLKEDTSIRFGQSGWAGRLAEKLDIQPQAVSKWLMRVDPEFYLDLPHRKGSALNP